MSLYGASAETCHLSISSPSAGGVGSGAYTAAVLFMPNLFGGSATIWQGYDGSNFSHRGLYVDGDMWCLNEQADTNIPSFGNPQQWYWLVVSKASVTEAPRAHWAIYDPTNPMSWSHLDALTTQVPRSDITRVCLGDEFGAAFKGNIACIAMFTSELSDSVISAVCARSSADILAASPQFFAHWPQADGVGSTFHDIAGDGVETVRSGNWAVSTDPPSFSFALGRSGKPKVWNGSAWVQHSAKVYSGSTWDPHKMNGATVGGWITSK
jgi:hypothetical protein